MVTEIGLDSVRRDDRSVVSMGMFDGVHRGHQTILDRLRQVAAESDGHSVVITFDPHPQAVLRGQPVPLLTTVEEKGYLLADLGIDRLVVLPFTKSLAEVPAVRFVEEILINRVGMQAVVLGHDHGFGRDRRGGEDLLKSMALTHGFGAHAVGPAHHDSDIVSSSRIRHLLQDEGAVQTAAGLLGRPYSVEGSVVKGDARGRGIGYPTANVEPSHPDKVIPLRGVYAVHVHRPSTGQDIGGMMNIGVRPTFSSENGLHLEVHLFDFDDQLYGETLRITFRQRIRDELRFPSVESLIEQLSRDQYRCKQVLTNL